MKMTIYIEGDENEFPSGFAERIMTDANLKKLGAKIVIESRPKVRKRNRKKAAVAKENETTNGGTGPGLEQPNSGVAGTGE